MIKYVRHLATVVGAAAIAGSLMTNAFASQPGPFHAQSLTNAKKTTFNGSVVVSNVLKVKNNSSVYGKLYAHGGQQVWKGLLVRTDGLTVAAGGITAQAGGLTVTSGGVKTDSLQVLGNSQLQSVLVSQNLQATSLQADTLNGTTLALTGAASIGGTVTAGGLSTTGTVSAGTLSTTGSFNAGAANLGNLTVTGNVNFTNAHVTGITLADTNVPSLTLSASGKTATLGIDTNGALTGPALSIAGPISGTGNLVVGGSASVSGALTVNGQSGVVTGNLQAPNASNTTTPGPLTIEGSTVTISGNVLHTGDVTLGSGSDLTLSSTATTGVTSDSHVLAGGDADFAGTKTLSISGGGEKTADVTFQHSFASQPIVVLTATGDPAPGATVGPKVWTTPVPNNSTGPYTGFTIHYLVPTGVPSSYTATYAYHVIGA